MTAPTEHAEQATTVAWFDRSYPALAGRMFAIPNGAHLAGNIAQRAKQVNKLKAEGMQGGVPDMMLPVARGRHHGLFIEVKRRKGSRTSDDQKDWNAFLLQQGYKAVICKGFEEARAAIEEYMELKPTPL